MTLNKTIDLAGQTLGLETGRLAKQADGAVVVRYGDTVVLATVVGSQTPKENAGFFPLSVEYREKAFAVGKIPGGFFKREGRPTEKETLSSRLVDRPIRPLFPKFFPYEVQVFVSVLSSDREHDPDVLGIIGASAAVSISDIPFDGPIGAVRVGRVSGEFVINPTFAQLAESDMNVVVAASEDAIAMVEGEASEISEDAMVAALEFAHEACRKIVRLQKELVAEAGKSKRPVPERAVPEGLVEAVRRTAMEKLPAALMTVSKMDRRRSVHAILDEIRTATAEAFPESDAIAGEIFGECEREIIRQKILSEKKRIDGRGVDDIRPIACEVAVLPRTHGSALFTRGETQSMTVATLGTKTDEQRIEGLEGESWKTYMLHYNFPPFSVGEVKPFRGPSRREIGHGNLAERALKAVIPTESAFPYTLRIVSDILESNGSSSMATVCAGSLALMDAGVPVKSSVAGIAMGLVKEGDRVAVLTDILGDEDHVGDMDFKVTGTRKGVTAFQMDIKIKGISSALMREALEKAKAGRIHILDIMDKTIAAPKPELSPYAPRIIWIKIDVDQIGAVIGPGGKMIREICERSGAEINIEDDGTIQIASADDAACRMAREIIEGLTKKPEPGKIYKGRVTKTTNFGAFVEILPGKEGLLHISEIAHHRVARVEEYMKVGDEVEVKLLSVSPEGKYELSRKVLIEKPAGEPPREGGNDRTPRDGGNDRPPRRR
ncbi:polyribonucleotide nucleotidyltransferase [bacterium]|nr:polyribonucleotide nucleotidyltransferase [bacterium]